MYYKVLLRPKRRQNDVHPVLLRTTPYYKVLLRTTKYYSSTTPYYKVLLCTTKYYSDRNDVRTTSIQYCSVLQSTTPVLYYSVLQSATPVLLLTTQYHSVLQCTTSTETTSERRPSSTTPYYRVLLHYYSVLQSTTLYYKVLLRPKRRQNDVHPVLLRTTKYYSSTTPYYKVLLQYYSVLQTYCSVLQSTTPTETTSERRPSSTTPNYKVLLQYCFVLQTTTPYYKVLLQYYSFLQRTILYYKVLLRPKRRQNDLHPVLLRTTKYYSSTTKYYSSTTPYYKVLLQYYSLLQTYNKVLLRTTEYYSSTTPYYKVLQKLPKRAFRARLPQLFKELASSSTFQGTSFQNEHLVRGFLNFKEQASKTSISCKASSTFQGTSFQNEHFVRDFRNFSRNKLPKRAFRARLPQLFKRQASKTSISCETSATFQATSFQNEHFVRDFRNFSRNKLPKRAFRARLPQLFKEQASKTSISYEAF